MKKIFIHVLTVALIAALAFGCLAGCTAAPKTEQVTPATPTTSATTETSADPAAATDLSGKKVALVLFGTNFDYFVYIGASAKKTAEEAGIQLDVLNASDFVDLSEKVSQVVTIKSSDILLYHTFSRFGTQYLQKEEMQYERRHPAFAVRVRGRDGYGHPFVGGCAEKQRGRPAAKASA